MKNYEENSSEEPTGSVRVADMASDDKPREKGIRHGVKSLTFVELIAIALGSGIPGKSVIELSREILRKLDNKPARLASMTVEGLCQNKGVGPAKAVQLLAAIELGMRVYGECAWEGITKISQASHVVSLMAHRLKFLDHEQFWILLLDRQNRVRYQHQISAGGSAATVVDLKMVFRYALENGAQSLIAVHNHPSGAVRPSVEDDNLTKRLKQGAQLLDMRLLDHVIIAENGFYSYMEEGRL